MRIPIRYVIAFALFLAIPFGYGSCNGNELLPLPQVPNTDKSDEIEALIASELYVGASPEEIEAFFEGHSINYSYDGFINRYNGIVRDIHPDLEVVQSVIIKVDLDQQKRFVESEVRDVFTGR